MGAKKITFKSLDKEKPAKFYINSACSYFYPTVYIKPENCVQVELGSKINHRVITVHSSWSVKAAS